ncbi:MAG: 16S rRNA (cytosine(1402)-N(4))-methyltransferase RsmH [Clostridia bacterium]|nr:16S rRNA (cytosine(1402)-N(4))-methyltransferase RsmH [Clostridia bacterium]
MQNENKNYHIPIMLKEILEGLQIRSSDIFVDCTLGGAGHSSGVIRQNPQGLLIGIDKDDDALNFSQNRLSEYENKLLIKSDFKNFDIVFQALQNKCYENGLNNQTGEVLHPNAKVFCAYENQNKDIISKLQSGKVDKILVDLGVSSHQLDTAERGFSFRFDAPLDMRMDKTQEKTAWHVVNFYPKDRLVKILYTYGEEKFAPQIVNAIMLARKKKTIDTTKELARIIESALPKKYIFKTGGAKKTFQAIRIEVNGELEGLEDALEKMIERLTPGGRLAVLTFHSLEDRIVKNVFKEKATGCICPSGTPICICGHKETIKFVNKKPITASQEEQTENPRSTSAKLRIIEKL